MRSVFPVPWINISFIEVSIGPSYLQTAAWLLEFCPFCQKFSFVIWNASSEFGTYRLCEQRRLRRACASAQSRQNLRCSHIQAVSQEEPSDRKPDPWPLWMAGHAQLKFVMTECSKTQIRLTGLILYLYTFSLRLSCWNIWFSWITFWVFPLYLVLSISFRYITIKMPKNATNITQPTTWARKCTKKQWTHGKDKQQSHWLSQVVRKPVFVMCDKQRRKSTCASVQSDQCLCLRCLDSIMHILAKSKMSRL